jgi:hypothetical protein
LGSESTFSRSVAEILYYYDPAQLGKLGVGEDEYASEANTVIAALRSVEDIKTLQWTLYDILVRSFSKENILPPWDKCYLYIAEEIWEVWQDAIDEPSILHQRRSL